MTLLMSTSVSVQNSLLYLRDPSVVDLPEVDGFGNVWATSGCLAFSCLPDSDGETRVSVGNGDVVPEGLTLAFDGILRSPTKRLRIEGVYITSIGELDVRGTTTRVRLWTEGPADTSEVFIEID